MDFEKLTTGEESVDVYFHGETCKVWYRPNRVTREFKAKALRMQREAERIQRRQNELTATLHFLDAKDDTPEAQVEDQAAEEAIKTLLRDDDTLKRNLDGLVIEVVTRWEVYQGSSMVPVDAEHLFRVQATFLYAILNAIGENESVGEVTGLSSKQTLNSH